MIDDMGRFWSCVAQPAVISKPHHTQKSRPQAARCRRVDSQVMRLLAYSVKALERTAAPKKVCNFSSCRSSR